jgi:hypothetical protein
MTGAFPFKEVDIGHRKVRHYEPGIYIGLPDEDYFQDPALGSSDIKSLLVSAPDYWHNSLYNPQRQMKESHYMDRGHALHAMLLRGPSFFAAHYDRRLRKEDHPDALVTVDQLRGVLESYGLAKSGDKASLIKRIRDAGATHLEIWDDLVAAQEASGKTIIEHDDYDRILIADAMVRKNPALAACFRAGIPEVAIFWEIDGVRFRAKLDWLAMNSTTDLKSFTNKMERPVGEAIQSTFWNQRHHLQASHYLNGRAQMARLIEEGRVFGDVDLDWLKKVAAVENDSFVFLFHQLRGAIDSRSRYASRSRSAASFASSNSR